MPNKFRILTLDGGGSWALIQVKALQALYRDPDKKGHDILADFDLVAANSGGSIVLGGLIENKSLSEILKQFTDNAQRLTLFAPLGFEHLVDKALETVLHIGPKYSASRKLIGLQQILPIFGLTRLDQLGEMSNNKPWPKLLICSYDYDLRRATFFRSDAGSLAAGPKQSTPPTLAEAIHASSNAPVNYFDLPAIFLSNSDYVGKRYWDGGIGGHNNPVLAAVTEAIANGQRYGCNLGSIIALSIGTGRTELPIQGGYHTNSSALVLHQGAPSLFGDIKKLSTCILTDPPDAASFITHFMLKGQPGISDGAVSGNLVRLNPVIRPVLVNEKWSLPNGISESDFESLANMDMDATEDHQVELISTYCDAWISGAAPNQAIHSAEDFSALIGHVRFDDAANEWRAILQR